MKVAQTLDLSAASQAVLTYLLLKPLKDLFVVGKGGGFG